MRNWRLKRSVRPKFFMIEASVVNERGPFRERLPAFAKGSYRRLEPRVTQRLRSEERHGVSGVVIRPAAHRPIGKVALVWPTDANILVELHSLKLGVNGRPAL